MKKIEFTPGHAELIRFMARELSNPSQDFLYLQHISAYHYGDPGAINKIRSLNKNQTP